MIPSSILPLALVSTVLQQLATVTTLSAQPCQNLHQDLLQRLTRFFTQPLTPQATYDFEIDLRQLLDRCGQQILEAALNHLEPEQPCDIPKHGERDGYDYCRKNQKSLNRGGLATLFGIISLQRCLYEPLQEARDEDQTSFAPLEVNLGVVAANATPALAERVGLLASQHTQQEVLDILKRDHHVGWSTSVLRKVTAAVSEGIAIYVQAARKKCLLGWLAQAFQSRGRHRVVLCVGRDGLMLPIRGEPTYKEGAVATVSVYDRRGRRLGTVYLAEMPEAYQVSLSSTLTELLQEVLQAWEGPLPRLVYVTDAGYHPTMYYREVLECLEHPRRPGQRLAWTWIVDFYHASSYVSQLAEALFGEGKARQAWSRQMRHLLLKDEHGWFRVLHSAAYYHNQKILGAKQEKSYEEAYAYLSKHGEWMAYACYRRQGLPIGSGVTEAGCKIVFTQRFKESGMTWGKAGGAVILQLRVAVLSGVWEEVYPAYLRNRPRVKLATQYGSNGQSNGKVA
jgi:alkylated DNA nucleotide flippase Atl1